MMTRDEILGWLREEEPARLDELWQQADAVRRQNVGDEVHLRGLIEISNICVRQCGYCGLRVGNRTVSRYRMTADEIVESAARAIAHGYGTVVLQSGEDYGCETAWLAEVIRRIKELPTATPLAVTLSLGERPRDDLVAWRRAGADRYLLRFETSNRKLYERIHPSLPGKFSDRFAILRQLQNLGYEVGSGAMIGVPGQSYYDLANDILKFRELDLEMIGVGPYIAHPETPLGREGAKFRLAPGLQVPNDELMTYKTLALTRINCPLANLPSTTALATLNKAQGRELGLMRGANVVMPNVTPVKYRASYEIYPAKACIFEDDADCAGCIKKRILSIGRTIGTGRGDSPQSRLARAGAIDSKPGLPDNK